jgi:hypothetical protein
MAVQKKVKVHELQHSTSTRSILKTFICLALPLRKAQDGNDAKDTFQKQFVATTPHVSQKPSGERMCGRKISYAQNASKLPGKALMTR